MIQISTRNSMIVLALAALSSTASLAKAAPVVGQAAPGFTAKDSNGETHTLEQFKGKYVVLEWLNHGCPYVKKHYNSKNMQQLQKQWTDKGVVWLSVVSSAKGKQGYQTPDETNATKQEKGSQASAILLDPEGDLGRLYAARTTPQMFVIDPRGVLIYAGAIDDKASTNVRDVPGATNYVSAALDAALAGKKVEVTTTRPYGCSVKY
ncbi:MAG: thioredoxin family protein [Myxococcota bacterium]